MRKKPLTRVRTIYVVMLRTIGNMSSEFYRTMHLRNALKMRRELLVSEWTLPTQVYVEKRVIHTTEITKPKRATKGQN